MTAQPRNVKISENDICNALIKLKDPDGSTYHQIKSYLTSCKDKLRDLPVKRLDAEIKKATKRGIERGMITPPKYGKRFRISVKKLKSKGLFDKMQALRQCRCVATNRKSQDRPKKIQRRCRSGRKSSRSPVRRRRRGHSRRRRRGRSRRGGCKSRGRKSSPSSKSKRKPYCSRYRRKDCIRRRRCRKRRGTLRYCSKYRSYCCRRRKKRCKK